MANDYPGVEKRTEEVTEEVVKDEEKLPTFTSKMAALGSMMRENARENLKFDSNIGNIDYDYVDTQQYKNLLGKCCDALGLRVSCKSETMQFKAEYNPSGKLQLIALVSTTITIVDEDASGQTVNTHTFSSCGVGVSTGGGYAVSIAVTNSIRNAIVNEFMLPTSDRDDDVRLNQERNQASFLTDEKKAEKREQLLKSTKNESEHATLMFAKVIKKRIESTLEGDVPEEFKKKLESFLKSKYDENGDPILLEGSDSNWIVKTKAANAILEDLDKYAK